MEIKHITKDILRDVLNNTTVYSLKHYKNSNQHPEGVTVSKNKYYELQQVGIYCRASGDL